MVAEASRPLVLVVDDYQDAREMYAEYLGAFGFAVAEAESGDEAVAKALELLPDAIVMDLSLPGMDGWTATRTLKTNIRTSAIPVIALTGNARSDASIAAREAGCDAFLSKPCLPEQMLAAVRKVMVRAHP
jgi:CheY-like chemotaxis protein